MPLDSTPQVGVVAVHTEMAMAVAVCGGSHIPCIQFVSFCMCQAY